MAFLGQIFVRELVKVAVKEVVEVAAIATVAVTTTYVAGRTVGAIVDNWGESSSSSSSSGCFNPSELKTIWDWWGNGLTSCERTRLLELGYGDRSGCFRLEELKGIICRADKEPGAPTEKDGFVPEKDWNGKLKKAPNSQKKGYPHKDGSVWVPTGKNTDNVQQHGGPHWDVEHPDGSHENVYPGGRRR